MTPSISFMTTDEITRRREELLQQVGLDLETLRTRGAEFRLSPEQALILKEIDDLDFLAGE